jgi:hypothetical protein
MSELRGKKVLMFSPYGATKHYGEAIKEELISRGVTVTSYDERPSQRAINKIVIRLFKKKVPQIFDRYIRRVINENLHADYNYILICRGEAFTPQSIDILKKAFPDAMIILYCWDVFKYCDLSSNISYVNKAMSFDPEDVDNNPGLQFRPTFFVNEYRTLSNHALNDYKNDFLFIGTLYENRHVLLAQMKASFAKQGLTMVEYLYVPSILLYFIDLIMKFPYVSLSRVHFLPISMLDTVKLLKDCKAILDITFTATQKSLSMRAYEAMAAHKKYITNNPEVMKYDFYNPNNIAVINMETMKIPKGFLEKPFEPVPEEVLYKYSVQGLVDDLFS